MIVEKIIEYFLREQQEHERSEGIYYVTDLTQCPLKREFSLKFPSLTAQILIQPNVIIGKLLHKGLEDILREMGADIEVLGKMDIEDPDYAEILTVCGRVDAILVDKDKKIGIEIKYSSNSRELPYMHHYNQAMYYNTLFDLEKTILVYFTPRRIAEYPVEGRRPLEHMREAIRRTKGPMFDWECKYCPFRTICKYAVE